LARRSAAVKRYLEVIADPDVAVLGSAIGHWPQLEDPDGVLQHSSAFVDRHASD